MDDAAGVREAAMQAHSLECLGRRTELQGHPQDRLRRLDHEFRALDMARRERRAVVLGPCRHLALCGKRRHHLGADSAEHGSAADDAAVTIPGPMLLMWL